MLILFQFLCFYFEKVVILQWLVQCLLHLFVATLQEILLVWKQIKKQILLCEAIDHSLNLVNLDCVSTLTGFSLRLQPAPTRIIGTKWFAWNLLLLSLLWSFVIPDLQNDILMSGWLAIDSPLGWITLLNKSLKNLSPETGYNEQIDLLHTEDRARMHKTDAQDYLHRF